MSKSLLRLDVFDCHAAMAKIGLGQEWLTCDSTGALGLPLPSAAASTAIGQDDKSCDS